MKIKNGTKQYNRHTYNYRNDRWRVRDKMGRRE